MPPKKKKSKEEKAVSAAEKKARNAIPSRDDRIAAFTEKFNKEMKGAAYIKRASEYSLPFMTKRYPTGMLSLDLELGGGFPAGGISQIVGTRNAGKTYTAWQVIRQQQFYKGDRFRGLLAMTEIRADRGQARKAGVQIAYSDDDIALMEKARREQGYPPFTPEELASLKHEVGKIYELHGMSGEDLFDGILEAVESNAFHVIVIDSFGNIMSGAEAESESLSDKTYGGASGPITQFCKKLGGLLTMDDQWGRARDVCILGINQIRDDIKDPNKAYRSPGGKALEHAKLVDIFLQNGASVGGEVPLYTPQGTKQRFMQYGKEVNWKIEKGKAGIHEGGRGSYIYDFRIDSADFYTDTLVAGVREGIVEAAGAWLGIPDGNGDYIFRAQGREAFVRGLIEDTQARFGTDTEEDSLMNLIRKACLKKRGIQINYDWDDNQ